MRIESIHWDDNIISHIARHGVDPIEVEQVCFLSNPLILKANYSRYAALGQTRNGRYLTVIFQYRGRNEAGIITARAMAESERRLYHKRR